MGVTYTSADLLPDNVKCSSNFLTEKPKKISRIVGGTTIAENSWSWLVHIKADRQVDCQGAILNSKWILTAAHCCNRPVKQYRVWSGVHDTKKRNFNEKHKVKQLIRHDGYSQYHNDNDICLVELQDEINFNKAASFGCLGDLNERVEDVYDQCYVAGGGLTQYDGKKSDFIQSIKVNIFSHEQCIAGSKYKKYHVKDSIEFCAGYMEGGKDACQGDSGGPLVCVNSKNEPVIHGLVSWGDGCANPEKPGVYTRVGNYLNWISQQITGEMLPDASETIETEEENYHLKLPQSILDQTLEIIGQMRKVVRTGKSGTEPLLPLLKRHKAVERITQKIKKVDDRLSTFVTTQIDVNDKEANYTVPKEKLCINWALQIKKEEPTRTETMKEIMTALRGDQAKINQEYYSVPENVNQEMICKLIDGKIQLLHNYNRKLLYKCNTGYKKEEESEEDLKNLKKRVELLKIFLLNKLGC